MKPKDDADFVKLVGHSKFDPLAGVPYEPALPRVVEDSKATTELKSVQGDDFPDQTDAGNSVRFARRFAGELRYVGSKGWLRWDGRRLKAIAEPELDMLAKKFATEQKVAAHRGKNADLAKHWHRTQSRYSLTAMTDLARGEVGIAASDAELDAEPLLINLANGVLDLETMKLHEHSTSFMQTKLVDVPYAPDAKAPRWLRFLTEVFPKDPDTVEFLRRSVGCSLTGLMTAQSFFMLHGFGSNGKTVFTEVLGHVVGEYGLSAAYSTFCERPQNGAPRSDLVRLQGVRFCKASEGASNARLDCALVKQLTGGEPLVARPLYRSEFEFFPEAKLWLQSNFRPVASDSSIGLWRRLLLIEFREQFGGRRADPHLVRKLLDEAPGILAWAARGANDWIRDGGGRSALCVSEAVRAASAEYRAEEDRLRPFVDECLIPCAEGEVNATDLYARYKQWAGSYALSPTKFGREMSARSGIQKVKRKLGNAYVGILLRR